MKKFIYIISVIMILLILDSCSKEKKKPFGAENIDYEQVEKINKEGPMIESSHMENIPPFSDVMVTSESGPERIDYSNNVVEPTADKEEAPDYGGIPIVIKTN